MNDLTKYSQDCDNGFRDAANDSKNPELDCFFAQRSVDFAEAATEFQAEVRRRGGDPETSASVTGDTNRGCADLQSMLAGKDDEAVLDEVERAGDHALKAFLDARDKMTELDLDGRDPAYPLVERHLESTQKSQDEARALRDAIRAQA